VWGFVLANRHSASKSDAQRLVASVLDAQGFLVQNETLLKRAIENPFISGET
jgi:hypothetical protein